MTEKNEEQINEVEEWPLEELVRYFGIRARDSGLEFDPVNSYEVVDFPRETGFFWPDLYLRSNKGNVILRAGVQYRLAIDEEATADAYDNASGLFTKALDQLVEGKMSDVQITLDKAVRDIVVPQVSLIDVDLGITWSIESFWDDEILRLEECLGGNSLRLNFPPQQRNYDTQDQFDAAIKDWELLSKTPTIRKYVERMQGIDSTKDTLNIRKEVIDLGIEMCKDKELDEELSYYLRD